jgi:hypothetical protein
MAAARKYTFDAIFSSDEDRFDTTSSINTFGYVDGNPLSRLDPRGEGWAAAIVIGGAIAVGGAIALGTYFEVKCLKKCNQYIGCPYPDDDEHIQERHLWWTKCRNTCSKSIIELFHSGGVADLTPTRP